MSVQTMFNQIARRYNLLNSVMTYGGDRRWRRFAVKHLGLKPGDRLLDVGTGTGKILFEARRQYPGITGTGMDFSEEMLKIADKERGKRGISTDDLEFVQADAQELPLESEAYEAVISGYLIRNVEDINKTLAEQHRVLKPGGSIVCIETAPPVRPAIIILTRFYFKRIIPFIGRVLASNRKAYTYLTSSTLGFKRPDEMIPLFEAAGFRNMRYREFLFGMNIVYWGDKSE